MQIQITDSWILDINIFKGSCVDKNGIKNVKAFICLKWTSVYLTHQIY